MTKSEIHNKINNWLKMSAGDFAIQDIYRDLDLIESFEREAVIEIVEKKVGMQEVERVGKRRGWYRSVDRSLKVIDWRSADTTPYDLRLPFGLSDNCIVYPKSLISISGEKNCGKTSLCLNIVKLNQNLGKDIYYFSSEMLDIEMKVRLQAFQDVAPGDWNFSPIHRTSDFVDVIQPDDINIIDYLEVHDDFWKVAGYMMAIFERLNKGIAIICVQKTEGSKHGRGGSFLTEKPRLTLSLSRKYNEADELDGSMLTVTNAKFPRPGQRNLNGLSMDYGIRGGASFFNTSGWYRIQD